MEQLIEAKFPDGQPSKAHINESTIEYCQIHNRILQHQLDTEPLRHTLQIQQNNALRTATGCTKTTPTDHIHRETKILKIRDHMDLKGAQFYNRIKTDTSHPLATLHQPT